MDWITTANGLIALITALCGLIGTGIGAFFAIKGFIQSFKQKNASERWALIMQIADEAMKAAEQSGKAGKEKKQMVIDTVNAACKSAGIELGGFAEQLADYIDQAIAFANSLNK